MVLCLMADLRLFRRCLIHYLKMRRPRPRRLRGGRREVCPHQANLRGVDSSMRDGRRCTLHCTVLFAGHDSMRITIGEVRSRRHATKGGRGWGRFAKKGRLRSDEKAKG
jgi:hypothetical protein